MNTRIGVVVSCGASTRKILFFIAWMAILTYMANPLFAACPETPSDCTVYGTKLFDLESQNEYGMLDGEIAMSDGGVPDWDSVYSGQIKNFPLVGPLVGAVGFKMDATVDGKLTSDDVEIFQGKAKDIEPVSSWKWTSGHVLDKNNLLHGFSVAIACPTDFDKAKALNCDPGHTYMFFGGDRHGTEGDAQIGFWFLGNDIAPTMDGRKKVFSGTHTEKDTLVVANFINGGDSTEVMVYQWDPNAENNLRLIGTGGRCGESSESGISAIACAITNQNEEQMAPWKFKAKNTESTDFIPQTFFEGGIDITALQSGTPCVSHFQVETRSSQSITASLKDFISDNFDICSIAASKTCSVTRLTDPYDDTAFPFAVSSTITIENNGFGSFDGIGSTLLVIDTPSGSSQAPFTSSPPDPINSDLTSLLASADLGETWDMGEKLTFDVSFYSESNGPTNSVEAILTLPDGTLIDSKDTGVTCKSLQLSPTLFVEKYCSTKLQVVNLGADDQLLKVAVDFNYRTCNTGDIPLDIHLVDQQVGLDIYDTLDSPSSCVLGSTSSGEVCSVGDCEAFTMNKACSDHDDCSSGYMCLQDPADSSRTICLNDDDKAETVSKGFCTEQNGTRLGQPVCLADSGSYTPKIPSVGTLVDGEISTSEQITFLNTINVTGTSTLEGVATQTAATSSNCDLCPFGLFCPVPGQ